jgi:hypothetical protein
MPRTDVVNWNEITIGGGPADWSQGAAVPGPPGAPGGPGPAGPPGATGATGARGSLWYQGPGVPGTIGGALPNDMYLDNFTGDVYIWS